MTIIATVSMFVAGVFAGAGVGWIYFHVLWRSVKWLRAARRPVAGYFRGLAVRGATISFILTIGVQAGLENLLAGLLGFVAAQVWYVGRLPEPGPRSAS